MAAASPEANGGLLLRATAEAEVDAEEVHYERHKEALQEALRGGRRSLEPRGDTGVGLLNQGATCYMNSLLQALFYTTEFRQVLLRWRFNAATHGDPAQSIPLQLQRLFAQLQLSSSRAVSTKALTAAFGFSDSASREQHDVQELCRLLFDALGRSAPTLSEEIDKLYSGKTVHYLRSQETADDGSSPPESRREEKFLDVQVPIEGCKTLEDALKKVVGVEVMDGDNQWFCEALGRNVDALKGMDFCEMPNILCLQLLRFVFDFTTMRRRKLTDALSCPLEIDLNFLFGQDTDGASHIYELSALCCHSGTAHGGHYHAFLREYLDKDASRWCDANDATVTVLTHNQEQGLFAHRKVTLDDGSEVEGPQAVSSSDAYFLVYRRRDCRLPPVTDGEVPELHRRDILEDNMKLAELQRAYEVHRQLMEVRVFAPTAAQLALRRSAAQQLQGLTGDNGQWAEDLRIEPASVALSVRTTKTVAEIHRRAVDALLAAAERDGEPWPWAMNFAETGRGGSRSRLCRFTPNTGETGAALDEQLPLGEALAMGSSTAPSGVAAPSLILEVRGLNEEFDVYDEQFASVVVCRWDNALQAVGLGARDVLRLRLPRALPASWLPDRSPSPPEPQPPAEEPAVADKGPQDFDEENMPDLFEVPAKSTPAKATEDTSPLVATVREAAAAALGLAQTPSLVVLTGPHAGNALLDDSVTLLQATRDGYGSWHGSDVLCVEPRVEADRQPQSTVLFERVRNTAHITFNHPDRPEFPEEFKISVSKDSTLSELKAKLAGQLGLDCNQLYIARAQKSPMFKDETKTLRALGLAEANFLFVGHGAPCGVDEFMLRVAFYTPAEKGAAAKARDALSHPAKGTSSVRSLREALAAPLIKWAMELQNAGEKAPFDAEGLQWKQLRIRDGQAGKQFALLRDERTLRSTLIGLSDGRQVAVQVLDQDEELTPDDLVVQLRPWRYETGHLYAPTEWIVNRTRSLADIREELTARFSGLLVQATVTEAADETAVANGLATDGASEGGIVAEVPGAKKDKADDRLEIVALPSAGPPFSVKRCAGLKWGISAFNASDPTTLQRPLSALPELRDNAVLVVRSALHAAQGPPVEPAAAKGASKAGSKGAPKAKGVASGVAAAAAAKARATGATAGSGAMPAARKERDLVIRVAHPEGDG